MVNKMWKINTAKDTILAIMKPQHERIISMILESKTEMKTFDIHAALEAEGFTISRASVINYCQLLAKNDVIAVEERTGKGGYRQVYSKLMSWESILESIHLKVISKMILAFPDSKYLTDLVQLLRK